MRRILAAALLAATALSGTLYGTAHAAEEGCVTEFVLPPGNDTEPGDPIVVLNPDGSISVNPPSARIPAPGPVAQAAADWAAAFVDCVV